MSGCAYIAHFPAKKDFHLSTILAVALWPFEYFVLPWFTHGKLQTFKGRSLLLKVLCRRVQHGVFFSESIETCWESKKFLDCTIFLEGRQKRTKGQFLLLQGLQNDLWLGRTEAENGLRIKAGFAWCCSVTQQNTFTKSSVNQRHLKLKP